MLSWYKPTVSVDLSFSALGDEGVKRLVKYIQNTTIRHLNVSCNNITTVGTDDMRRLITYGPSTLTSIVVSRNPLRDEGVCLLLQSVTDIMEYIEFVDVSMTSSSYQHVANVLHKVRSISFTVCDDSDIIGSSIASATMLKKIELTDLRHSRPYMIDGINQNKNIKTISLTYGYSDEDSCKDVETLVKSNRSITELKISFNHLQTVDVSTFLVDLIANPSIQSLNISLDCSILKTNLNLLHILEKIPPRPMLEHLKLHLSTDEDTTQNYHLICQNIYSCIQKLNSTRSTEGVVNPLVATVSIVDYELYHTPPTPTLTILNM